MDNIQISLSEEKVPSEFSTTKILIIICSAIYKISNNFYSIFLLLFGKLISFSKLPFSQKLDL